MMLLVVRCKLLAWLTSPVVFGEFRMVTIWYSEG